MVDGSGGADGFFVGVDLGTSSLKALLVDSDQRIVDQQSVPLAVLRPRPLWSEQDPEAWWQSTLDALDALSSRNRRAFSSVRSIGLSGQMHGAVLLDASDRVLRNAILWNDGRSAAECAELERRVPGIRTLTGNLVMPGFTAPKLLWVSAHEPDRFARTASVLLPKDYLRLRLSGVRASEMSDASGTSWLDVGARAWSPELVEATGLPRGAVPELYEGCDATGTLRPELAARWGSTERVAVAAGGGDQAAGAVGAGVVAPGDALIALGTSGVYFVAADRHAPNPERAVHAFCHCLPRRWHQMSVVLSAASCLTWVARLIGARDESDAVAAVDLSARRDSATPIFLPYLSGERTPHNDPEAPGVFFGLTHETTPGDLVRAVLEGVSFAIADGQTVLLEGGAVIDRVSVIGGGARSDAWGRILAAALDRPLGYAPGAEVGPAYGAARLARLAVSDEPVAEVCAAPPVDRVIAPDAALRERLAPRLDRFRDLYRALRAVRAPVAEEATP